MYYIHRFRRFGDKTRVVSSWFRHGFVAASISPRELCQLLDARTSADRARSLQRQNLCHFYRQTFHLDVKLEDLQYPPTPERGEKACEAVAPPLWSPPLGSSSGQTSPPPRHFCPGWFCSASSATCHPDMVRSFCKPVRSFCKPAQTSPEHLKSIIFI